MARPLTGVLLALISLHNSAVSCFVIHPHNPLQLPSQRGAKVREAQRFCTSLSAKRKKPNTNIPKDKRDAAREQDRNWIERAVPLDTSDENVLEQLEKLEYYSLGLSGKTFQTGPLSAQLLQMMLTRNVAEGESSPEVERGYRMYALDFAAKESTREALRQNGFDLTLTEYTQDMGLWGEIESIRLLDPATLEPLPPVYDSWEEVVDEWQPGQAFDFVVRQVPAKLSPVSLENVLETLDPDGEVHRRAEDDGLPGIPEEPDTLAAIKRDAIRRCDRAPLEAVRDDEAFRGDHRRGYRVINCSDLLESSKNRDGSENSKSKSGRCAVHISWYLHVWKESVVLQESRLSYLFFGKVERLRFVVAVVIVVAVVVVV